MEEKLKKVWSLIGYGYDNQLQITMESDRAILRVPFNYLSRPYSEELEVFHDGRLVIWEDKRYRKITQALLNQVSAILEKKIQLLYPDCSNIYLESN